MRDDGAGIFIGVDPVLPPVRERRFGGAGEITSRVQGGGEDVLEVRFVIFGDSAGQDQFGGGGGRILPGIGSQESGVGK